MEGHLEVVQPLAEALRHPVRLMFLHPFFWGPTAAGVITAGRVSGDAAGGQSVGLLVTLITTIGGVLIAGIGLAVQLLRSRESSREDRRIRQLEAENRRLREDRK